MNNVVLEGSSLERRTEGQPVNRNLVSRRAERQHQKRLVVLRYSSARLTVGARCINSLNLSLLLTTVPAMLWPRWSLKIRTTRWKTRVQLKRRLVRIALIFLLYLCSTRSFRSSAPPASFLIHNPGPYHFDVILSVSHSLKEYGVLPTISTKDMYGFTDLVVKYYDFPKGNLLQLDGKFLKALHSCSYANVLIVTFPAPEFGWQALSRIEAEKVRACGINLYLVVHNYKDLELERFVKVLDCFKTVTFLTLMQQAHMDIQRDVEIFATNLPMSVRMVYALFDVPFDRMCNSVGVHRSKRQKTFVLQGNLELDRRSYGETYKSVMQVSKEGGRILLKVMGYYSGLDKSASDQMDKMIAAKTVQRSHPNYDKFLCEIARADCLLSAFASSLYYHHKFSSSVGMSLITETPILLNSAASSVYGLTAQTCFIHDGSQADGLRFVLKADPALVSQMRRNLRDERNRRIALNREIFQEAFNPR